MINRRSIAKHLFGRHVSKRAHDVAGHRQALTVGPQSQPKVCQPQFAAAVQQQIRWFDVPVHNARLVRMLQGIGHRSKQACQLLQPAVAIRQRKAGPIGCARGLVVVFAGDTATVCGVPGGNGVAVDGLLHRPGQPVGERLPGDQRHDVKMSALFMAHQKHGHDMRMMQGGGRHGFVAKALQAALVEGGGKRQHLHGDPSLQCELFGFVNDPHAAAADLLLQPVVTQHSVLQRVGGRLGVEAFLTGRVGIRRGRLPRGAMNEVETAQAVFQLGADVGVFFQQFGA